MTQMTAREEASRLRVLDQYELLGAPPDLALNDITELASQICGTTLAGISLVGFDAIFYQARVGPGPGRVPRGNGRPCENAILLPDLYEVQDARYHPDFRPDGILVGGRTFRFYAGAPLCMPDGTKIGCLFVQDAQPRALSQMQRTALATLARQVVSRFELNFRARHLDYEEQVRTRVESALLVERNFVSTVLDTVGALVAVFDTAGRIVRFNRTCEQASGYDFSSLVGRYLWEQLIPAQDVPRAIENFDQLRSGNFPASFENHWQHRDGSLRRIAWSATALVDPQGQTTFIIATGIDVTDQRAAEATLRESEARYRQLVEGSLGMVCTHSLTGEILSVNKHGAESLGRSVEEMVGQNLLAFMKRSDHVAFHQYLDLIIHTGEAQGRLQLIARNSDPCIIAFRNKLIQVEDGKRVPYILGFGVDISEQVRAEEKLRALIHQSNSILESVGDGIYGIDLEGRVTVINPAAAQMLGFKPHELLGQKLHEIIHHTRADGSPYLAAESAISQTVVNLDTVRVANEVFWRKDGTSFPVEYVARPQIDSSPRPASRDGRAIGVVVAFRDTTERHALDRMKDEFISTVSHELRTPLTSLRAALGLINGGALDRKPDRLKQMLEIASGNTDRLIKLVNDILDIERIGSGNAELHATIVTAQGLLEQATTLQQVAAEKYKLHFALESNGVEVYGDPDRILQALTNLISNAIKFSPVGGTISLSAHHVDDHEARFDIHDTGRGIPIEMLETIFERFQQVDASDSRAMGGTGLGLAICRSIIAQHGGRIWATSPPGQGATFHFTLPRRPASHLR